MKIVLDSNILLVTLGRKSRFRPIWDAFIAGRYNLVVSNEILYEYQEILNQYSVSGISSLVLELFLESPDVLYQQIFYSWNVITDDADDNKFFDAAVASNADYLVTNDTHFNSVKNLKFPHVKIINADSFLAKINQ